MTTVDPPRIQYMGALRRQHCLGHIGRMLGVVINIHAGQPPVEPPFGGARHVFGKKEMAYITREHLILTMIDKSSGFAAYPVTSTR